LSFSLARFFNVEGIPHAFTFANLQGLLNFALALPLSVIPLLALDLLGDAQQVSALYLVVSIFALAGALALPMLVNRLGRIAVTLGGTVMVVVAALLFTTGSIPAFYVATIFYTVGFFAMELTLNVATMDNIARQSFVRFEALRMCSKGLGFTVGPWLGVVIAVNFGLIWPFVIMAVLTVFVCGLLLMRCLVVNRRVAGVGHDNPLHFIPRFVRQPRILLAYVLAIFRSAWWNIFFVFAPIYCVESGYTDEDAGLVVSLGAAATMLAPLWGRLGGPLGMRRQLIVGYVATALAAFTMTAVSGFPPAGIAMLILACVCASWLDAVSNAPFARAVRPHQRAEMASVYTTYRDTGRVMSQSAFTVILLVFPVASVFAVTGLGMLGGAWFSRYIPRRY
jgi:MFS transporter, ACDE family, multidrug resistance protein